MSGVCPTPNPSPKMREGHKLIESDMRAKLILFAEYKFIFGKLLHSPSLTVGARGQGMGAKA